MKKIGIGPESTLDYYKEGYGIPFLNTTAIHGLGK